MPPPPSGDPPTPGAAATPGAVATPNAAATPDAAPAPPADASPTAESAAAQSDELRLAGAAHLEHGTTRVFEIDWQGRRREAFVLSYDGKHYAYLNECPHWSVELDLGDGHFYDEELDRIYCKNHGALFHPVTGECETGPCFGRSLVPLRLRRDGDDLLVKP